MMAFLLISLGELSSGRSVLEQLSAHPIWTTFFAGGCLPQPLPLT